MGYGVILWPPPWSRKTPWGRIVGSLLLITLAPLVFIITLLFSPVALVLNWLSRRGGPRLTKAEVARIIETFVNGQGSPWDWDEFVSVPINDPYLDTIRECCARLDEEFPPNQPGQYCGPAGLEIMKRYVAELRRADA